MGLDLSAGKSLVIPLLGAPGVKLSKTTLRENLTNERIQLKTLELLIEKFKPDGIFPFMDLTVEAEALGLEVDFADNDNPSIRNHCIKTIENLKSIRRRYKGISGRMPIFLNIVENLAKNFSLIVGAYVIGPFTLVGELMGLENLCLNLMMKPASVHKFLDFVTRVIKDYAYALLTAGADIVIILEPSAVILSPRHFEEFSGKYISHLVSDLGTKLMLHICGNSNHILKQMSRTGIMGLSVDSPVNLKETSNIVSEDVILMGNLDPIKVFLQSNPEEIAKATRILLEEMKGIRNFILSSGCDLPINTPLENIEAFMFEARKPLQ